MSRCVAHAPPRLLCWVRLVACLTLLTALTACGSHPTQHAHTPRNPSRYYPPPGPPSDPWGPYIHEASGRFGIPELWIHRVMRQESGGQEDVISWAGAMGLMQVMPDTYDGLHSRYSLGDDPFDPHNNILAGTAYLREMYNRFGSPGFLAAYNAGPNRLDQYLNSGTPLPAETVNYVASIAPLLGPGTPMSGPLAVYAGGPVTRMAAAHPTPAGCYPDAAYNPDGPCTPFSPAPFVPAEVQPPVVTATVAYSPPFGQGACDPDAAYDPTRPCQPLLAAPAVIATQVAYAPADAPRRVCDPDAAYDPVRSCRPLPAAPASAIAAPAPQPTDQPMPAQRTGYTVGARPLQQRIVQPAAFIPGPPPGRWAIQVGAFASLAIAQAAAESARSALPNVLRTAKIELPPTAPLGTQVAFRARLFGLSPSAAVDACSRLNSRGVSCITVPPPHDSF